MGIHALRTGGSALAARISAVAVTVASSRCLSLVVTPMRSDDEIRADLARLDADFSHGEGLHIDTAFRVLADVGPLLDALAAVRELAAEHWDWKAGQVLAQRLRAILAAAVQPEPERCGKRIRGLYGAETYCQRESGHQPVEHTPNDGIWRRLPEQPESAHRTDIDGRCADCDSVVCTQERVQPEPERCSTCDQPMDSPPCCTSPNGGSHTVGGGCEAAQPEPTIYEQIHRVGPCITDNPSIILGEN